MNVSTNTHGGLQHQEGLSYVEVLLSLIILAAAIVPAIESIRTGMQTAGVHEEVITKHYSLLSKMQEIKSIQFDALLSAAKFAGSNTNPSEYSDAVGEDPRRLVYLSYYDTDDSDSDSNVFTILDSNSDGDNNPYTTLSSESGLSILWISIEHENSNGTIQTLVMR